MEFQYYVGLVLAITNQGMEYQRCSPFFDSFDEANDYRTKCNYNPHIYKIAISSIYGT